MADNIRARVTLKDISRAAGCSLATVSTILNGSKGNSLASSSTRERVRDIARQLGYRPNVNARRLSSTQGNPIIALLTDSMASPINRDICSCLERLTAASGFQLQVGICHDDFDAIVRHIDFFLSSGIDKLICVAHTYPEFGAKIPPLLNDFDRAVFVGEPMAATGFPIVTVDDYGTFYNAARLILETGRRRIFHLRGEFRDRACELCHAGFQAAHRDCGVEPSPEAFVFKWINFHSFDEVAAMLDYILPRRPDALMVGNDETAFWCIQAFAERGIRVPGDIALFSCDLGRFSRFTRPALAGIRYDAAGFGEAIMKTFLDDQPAGRLLVPAEIVPGESCQ